MAERVQMCVISGPKYVLRISVIRKTVKFQLQFNFN